MNAIRKLALKVSNSEVDIKIVDWHEYLCLTHMAKNYGKEDAIKNWMRNKDTIEFLGVWENLNNPDFKQVQLHQIRLDAWVGRFLMSPQKWISETWAIWIKSVSWRYGWTYAHMDIALEFATYLSAEFKLLILKDYQRLKDEEKQKLADWYDFKRQLSKVNYQFMTDSVKENLIPEDITKQQIWWVFAEEADLINIAMFWMTAWEWKKKHPKEAKMWLNMRELATANQLLVLANLEMKNADLINEKVWKEERLLVLNKMAIEQMSRITKWAEKVKKVLGTWNTPKYLK